MVIDDSNIEPIQRLQEIKDTHQFTTKAMELINTYSRNSHNPNFHDWLFNVYLPNFEISEYLILSNDWDDIDRNLINTAHYEYIYPILAEIQQ